MELLKVNHVITEVKLMLNRLVDDEVIEGIEAKNLLPVIVSIVLKNETIKIEVPE